MMNLINKYFPEIDNEKLLSIKAYTSLLLNWNEKINLISRKDHENILIHHILHSLSIAKFIKFKSGSDVMDLGTGGGLPGIPLAIIFPESNFYLVDRIGKKINVVSDMVKDLKLQNVECIKADANEVKKKFHFIINRGVMPQGDIVKIAKKKISHDNFNELPNGVISLKGGDLQEEIKDIKNQCEIIGLNNFYSESFFDSKVIIYTPIF